MRLFGRSKHTGAGSPGAGPARPLVVALLQGWGTGTADPRVPAFSAKTPAYNRFARRAAATHLALPPVPASMASSLAAIALGTPPADPRAPLETLMRAEGGLMAHESFRTFAQDLNRIGGDCHLLCCLTPSGIEGCTAHAARIAATLAHAGIRVWVHVVLDGRDTAHDAGLKAMHDFREDVAGVADVQFATVSGRAFALDAGADAAALALVRDVMVEATPQTRGGLGVYVDDQNRGGRNDGDVTPMADITYPGMRSDDALLVLHPRAEGFDGLMAALTPDADLTIPARRPVTLAACRRVTGWPRPLPAGTPALQPLIPLAQTQEPLPSLMHREGLSVAMAAPRDQIAIWAEAVEGTAAAASRAVPASNAVEAADAAVQWIKQGDHDVIFALLGGVPAAARTPVAQASLPAPARRIIEQQDKALGRLAAIIERRGGTLVTIGTDTSLTPADALPCLIHGGGIDQDTHLSPGTLADVTATLAQLAGLTGKTGDGTSLLETDTALHAAS